MLAMLGRSTPFDRAEQRQRVRRRLRVRPLVLSSLRARRMNRVGSVLARCSPLALLTVLLLHDLSLWLRTQDFRLSLLFGLLHVAVL